MRTRFLSSGIAVFAIMLTATQHGDCQVMVQPNPSEQVVLNATSVLAQTMTMQSGIPQNLLAGAQGIVIVPNMIRGAFIFGAQYGRGVLLVRNPQGGWQAPRMVTMAGGSFGYQIGVQATDLVLVFRTPQSVANLLAGTLKIGVDASAAAGPVGRQTSAATDLQLGAEILSYSRARGIFAGVSIDGSVISLDPAADALYYQPPGTIPASAMQLCKW
jgi:lipid-binding SYLF domain-containing protein